MAVRGVLLVFIALAMPAWAEEPLRLNQIQVIGTHNSYRLKPAPGVMRLIELAGKDQAQRLDYTHRPLPEQFSKLGIRQIELDVFADPKGGLFAKPAGYALAKAQGLDAGPDPNPNGILDRPGFKILHVQDIDYRSTVPTLDLALDEVLAWSQKHPRHLPIAILVELKDGAYAFAPTKPVKFDAKSLDQLDAAIRAKVPPEKLITPDDVRGNAATLREAILQRGWPSLEDARGKLIFLLDNEGPIRDLYLQGHASLKGRVLFATVDEQDAAAAFFKTNDPVRDFDAIQRRVRAGFLVRTRADVETMEARKNDTRQREKAFASGAQFISTDYPEPRVEWSPYVVRFPGGAIARVNPVSAPDGMAPPSWEPER